jgi:outer membrane protein
LNKTRYPITLLLAALLAMPMWAWAQEFKVGYVNPARIMDEAPQAEAARKKLESEFAPREKELLASQKELRAMEDKLAKDSAVMSETEQNKLEREMLARKREIKNAQDEFREDLNIRRNEELGKLQRRVFEVIVELAKQEKYDLIVGDAIYASEQVDMTDKVLQKLKTESANGRK